MHPLASHYDRQARLRSAAHKRTSCIAARIDGSAGSTRRRGPGRQRRSRPSPAMPLLRRPHDHRRELWARRRTPRPAIARSRGQGHDAMTPITASLHLPPANPRFRRRIAVAPAPPKARATPSIRLRLPCRLPRWRQTRHRDRRSAADYAGQRIHNASHRIVKSP